MMGSDDERRGKCSGKIFVRKLFKKQQQWPRAKVLTHNPNGHKVSI